MMLLAIETSCDETSVAVVQNGVVLTNVVASQIKLHEEYGGVVPELASREHLRNLHSVAAEAMARAGVGPEDIDAFAATQGPGLPSALMIGFQAAQAMAFVLRKPLYGINHHEAHLYSPWIKGTPPRACFEEFEPSISLIVSGGHTILAHVRAEQDHIVLGSTVDDAAGECFDKIAKLIGLPYPGGPALERLASGGNSSAHSFPRPLLQSASDDFSFSGLKTSVRYFIRDNPAVLESASGLRDLCASAQAAIVEVLVTKTVRAARRLQVGCVTASGGVTCNRLLRSELELHCQKHGLKLCLADQGFCTDNAGMVGILAERKILLKIPATGLGVEINPYLALGV